MMQKIIGNCIGHNLKDAKFLKSNDFMCTSCAMGKLILQPSLLKIHAEPFKETFVTPFNHYVVILDTL
jgi:hypothetical protein